MVMVWCGGQGTEVQYKAEGIFGGSAEHGSLSYTQNEQVRIQERKASFIWQLVWDESSRSKCGVCPEVVAIPHSPSDFIRFVVVDDFRIDSCHAAIDIGGDPRHPRLLSSRPGAEQGTSRYCRTGPLHPRWTPQCSIYLPRYVTVLASGRFYH